MLVENSRLVDLLNEVRSTIAFDQPMLSASVLEGQVIVNGLFRVLSDYSELNAYGTIVEYQIQIFFDPKFPDIQPKVFEVGNTIPRNADDSHINPDDSCCVVVWEAWTGTANDKTVQDYFDGPLKNFFLGQYIKRVTGVWPFGEEKHGREGVVNAFAELLGCDNDERQVIRYLRSLKKDWPRGHWDCPCGSGLIIRKCCADELAKLSKKVPSKKACRMLKCLEN